MKNIMKLLVAGIVLLIPSFVSATISFTNGYWETSFEDCTSDWDGEGSTPSCADGITQHMNYYQSSTNPACCSETAA